MRIVNLTEEFHPCLVEVDLAGDEHWIRDFLQQRHSVKNRTKTVLVVLQEDSAKKTLSVLECVLVQYFASGNYGFVKFLGLNDRYREDNECRLQLINEAIAVINKYAQQSGYNKCDEIFSMVSKKPKFTMVSKRLWSEHCKCLYAAGFRLIETDSFSSNISTESHVLVYKPHLVPNFQVEDGVVGDHISTSDLLNFCEDLISSMDSSYDGKQAVKQIKAHMNIFKESSRLMSSMVKSSFPWNGRAGPCPDNQVAIVGGGLAGLAAAASLSKAGFDVVLLEAANYLGGRVKQVQPFKGFPPFDLGGEFIHGSNTVVNKIAHDNGWVVLPESQCKDEEEGEKIYYKGKLYSLSSDQPEIKSAREAWTEIINSKYRHQDSEPGSVSDSLKVRLEEKGLSRDVLDVMDWWKMKISAGSLEHYGVREGRRRMESKYEWGLGNFRLAESYSQLVKYYLDNSIDVDKRLNWQVKDVVWKGEDRSRSSPGGRILLKNQHGEVLTAKYVIITVPLTVLKDGDITFVPALPASKNAAIDTIQMLGAWKIVCRFKHRFWPETLHQIYSVRGFVSEIWTCTRDSPDSDERCHVIVGFETAEPADEKSVLSGQEALKGFLSHLDKMFGTTADPRPASNSFMDYVYFHWSNHPFIRGGYTSPTAHAYDSRHVLASSVEDRLFFAGEATSLRSCSTVPTAIETGTRVADEVCRVAGLVPCAKL
ncbi:putative flavin-containing monoamine oxidase A [Oculina patagonica]